MTTAPGSEGTTIDIPAGEHDILRLFAINLPREAMREMLQPVNGTQPTPSPAAQLLGIGGLDDRHAELFDTTDLAGLGLRGYLSEGYDLAPETLAPDAARLDAIKGYALLLLSQAFDRRATRLSPIRSLNLVATYALPGADNRMGRFTPPGSRARIGATGTPSDMPRTRSPWPPLLLLIAAIAAILLWQIFTL
ncbi:hypothetical protein RXV86_13965 [Alisedimentitalea sp. MJ-SS2]|uniref:hypothetical protein n=1 Tax=Aliisedimentitalea sp. MJ-SS2 TaxID=3049795 RepID=UPI002913F77E|nr:hypothetical protein [Alisedimentitalea sp. MJ-SS2]MDU8928492.1 hypothetical protein [Alisedimentitalea sp. MJ-SS2]